MTEPVIVEQLKKTYFDDSRGEVRAVQGINFSCAVGEIFGLLGANGAGKTTTLRMLATIMKSTSGTARIMGYHVVDDALQVRQHLGFYSATTALYPRLTARETIEFFMRINKYSAEKVKERVNHLIDQFNIGAYADARVDKLSSGMKQKVAIARTIAHDPPILIFDEPTVGLDVLNAIEMQDIIQDLKAQGKTIIFSTHIMSEAEKLCDRIAIIHKGRILACDTLDNLRLATAERYLEDIFIHFVKDLS